MTRNGATTPIPFAAGDSDGEESGCEANEIEYTSRLVPRAKRTQTSATMSAASASGRQQCVQWMWQTLLFVLSCGFCARPDGRRRKAPAVEVQASGAAGRTDTLARVASAFDALFRAVSLQESERLIVRQADGSSTFQAVIVGGTCGDLKVPFDELYTHFSRQGLLVKNIDMQTTKKAGEATFTKTLQVDTESVVTFQSAMKRDMDASLRAWGVTVMQLIVLMSFVVMAAAGSGVAWIALSKVDFAHPPASLWPICLLGEALGRCSC